MSRGIMVVGLTALIGSISACGAAAAPSGPSVSQFKAGPCHQAAVPILDVATVSGAVEAGSSSGASAYPRLTTDQGQLASMISGFPAGQVQGQVRTLVTDLGLFRFTVDHHTDNGTQAATVARDAAGIVSTCLTP